MSLLILVSSSVEGMFKGNVIYASVSQFQLNSATFPLVSKSSWDSWQKLLLREPQLANVKV
jgi:hypothetical protein